MAKSLSVFLPDILIEVNGCAGLVAERTVLNVIQDFATRTHVHTAYLDELYVIGGIDTYQLSAPRNSSIVSVMSVTKDGTEFADYSFDLIDFVLNEVPEKDFRLKVKVALKPSRTAADVDDRFYDVYADAVIDGAKARLMMQSGKPWANPALGAKYQADYEAAVTNAKIRMNKSASNKDLTMHSRRFV